MIGMFHKRHKNYIIPVNKIDCVHRILLIIMFISGSGTTDYSDSYKFTTTIVNQDDVNNYSNPDSLFIPVFLIIFIIICLWVLCCTEEKAVYIEPHDYDEECDNV